MTKAVAKIEIEGEGEPRVLEADDTGDKPFDHFVLGNLLAVLAVPSGRSEEMRLGIMDSQKKYFELGLKPGEVFDERRMRRLLPGKAAGLVTEGLVKVGREQRRWKLTEFVHEK